ncbi:hypothetical protein BC567DRAFT_98896 [Phyllosticta citribraziliensis]
MSHIRRLISAREGGASFPQRHPRLFGGSSVSFLDFLLWLTVFFFFFSHTGKVRDGEGDGGEGKQSEASKYAQCACGSVSSGGERRLIPALFFPFRPLLFSLLSPIQSFSFFFSFFA